MGKSLINTIEMYFHHSRGYYDWVDRYIVLSQFFRDKMVEWGFPESKISYLPNHIDTSEIGVPEEVGGYVLYFGRLSDEKGLEQILAEAKRNGDIPHIIAGTGPSEEALKVQLQSENIRNVDFVGFQTGQALKGLIAGSRMTVISSVVYENCPMCILESFAYGKLVVGARIGGIPELIEEHEDGLTFECGNTAEFALAVREFWDNPDYADRAGLKGRQKVEARFSQNSHYEGLMAIYESVLENKKALQYSQFHSRLA